ncbi:MAG TPA: hypothetical protein VK895_13445, partial [Jiangellaceae bacterium]|nr:hypothetical protein [Jiangellaceae bacterium]
ADCTKLPRCGGRTAPSFHGAVDGEHQASMVRTAGAPSFHGDAIATPSFHGADGGCTSFHGVDADCTKLPRCGGSVASGMICQPRLNHP